MNTNMSDAENMYQTQSGFISVLDTERVCNLRHISVNEDGISASLSREMNGINYSYVEALIKIVTCYNPRLVFDQNSPLLIVQTYRNNIKMVELLTESGIDIDIQSDTYDQSALMCAA